MGDEEPSRDSCALEKTWLPDGSCTLYSYWGMFSFGCDCYGTMHKLCALKVCHVWVTALPIPTHLCTGVKRAAANLSVQYYLPVCAESEIDGWMGAGCLPDMRVMGHGTRGAVASHSTQNNQGVLVDEQRGNSAAFPISEMKFPLGRSWV